MKTASPMGSAVDDYVPDSTQPLVLSQTIQTPPEIDTTIHARLISLFPKEVPSLDMRCESFVVGRDPNACQLTVQDKRISGKHMRIYRDTLAYYVEALGSAPTWHQGQLLKKGEVRMLTSGDSLSLLFNNTSKVAEAGALRDHVADFLFQINGQKSTRDNLEDAVNRYQEVKELGSGFFSKVVLGVDKRDGRHKVAIKKINVEVFEKFRRKRGTKLTLRSEIEVLRALQHKNMVQLLDMWESAGELNLVMELCEGGDLLRNILDQGLFPEMQGRKLFQDLLGAVQYLHERNIVHRDLKPETVLLTTTSRETMVAKITDFGLAVQLGHTPPVEGATSASRVEKTLQQVATPFSGQVRAKATVCRTFCGTPHYFAPEVIHVGRAGNNSGESYGKEVDMWSMGVMLYIILSAVPPFDDDNGDMEALYSRICRGQWEFDVEEFDRVSLAAKELVHGLLRVKTDERLTVAQALQHRWFSMDSVFTTHTIGQTPQLVDGSSAKVDRPVKRQKTEECRPHCAPYASPSSTPSAPPPPPYAQPASHFGVGGGSRPTSAK